MGPTIVLVPSLSDIKPTLLSSPLLLSSKK
jgi:hypothetical protein